MCVGSVVAWMCEGVFDPRFKMGLFMFKCRPQYLTNSTVFNVQTKRYPIEVLTLLRGKVLNI